MNLKRIGVIHTDFKVPQGMPINVHDGRDARGEVHIYKRYAQGLKDLSGFERIWLLFWLDRAKPARMTVVPYMDKTPRGVFATRSPSRPNPIGLSCVRLLSVKGNILKIAGVDMLDGTPLLDIKPYQPSDCFSGLKLGWMDAVWKDRPRADGRFTKNG